MATYKIYHYTRYELGNPSGHTLVGTVEAADLEDAFELTNSIESVWWRNSAVTLAHPVEHFDALRAAQVEENVGAERAGERPPRVASALHSTSVGDVLVDEAGLAHVCQVVGWSDAPDWTPPEQLDK